jgi:exosortase
MRPLLLCLPLAIFCTSTSDDEIFGFSAKRTKLTGRATESAASMVSTRHVSFAIFVAVSAGVFWKCLSALISYSLHDDSGSHIVLIPFVGLVLMYLERDAIFAETGSAIGLGAVVIAAGIFMYWLVIRSQVPDTAGPGLSLMTLLVIWIWAGGFLACYGRHALRAAAFPFFFLLLMVPLPDAVLGRTIYAMQEGTTEVTVLIFKLAGVPVLRQGFVLSVPGFAIEIAKECSGIRSSLALFITTILAVRFLLRTPWKMVLLVALSLPLAIVKNGVRVATLTILSMYVDPGFLHGSLHRDGGFVFFFLALAMLWPVLLLLQRSEPGGGKANPGSSRDSVTSYARG